MFDIKFSYIGPCMFQHLKISFFKRDFSEKIKTLCQGCNYTAQKMKFFIKNLFSKCDQIRELRVCSYLLKKSLIENFIFWTRLRPCHISMMKLLYASCQWLLAVNYFDKKWLFHIDWHGTTTYYTSSDYQISICSPVICFIWY